MIVRQSGLLLVLMLLTTCSTASPKEATKQDGFVEIPISFRFFQTSANWNEAKASAVYRRMDSGTPALVK